MAELHVIGQLVGASGFPNHSLFCKWSIQAGAAWKKLSGLQQGQTQLDIPQNEEIAYWSHPIDVHYATKGLQGWPKIRLEVWHQDLYGRVDLYSYGFCHIPTTPGQHKIDCPTWRPAGTWRDEVMEKFLGGGHQLIRDDTVSNVAERVNLTTETMGQVHLNIGIIMRNFGKYGIEC